MPRERRDSGFLEATNIPLSQRWMTPLHFDVLVLLVSAIAGLLGSLLGLGGGIIVIPALTLLFDIDIKYAIGASIVSVIATSSGAAAAYVREGMSNLRVAMFLEMATVTGAITGAYIAKVINGHWLFIIFGVVLAYSAVVMFRKRHEHIANPKAMRPAPWADYLQLSSTYYDAATETLVAYRVVHARVGLVLMYIAGAFSGLLGIGSGSLKVPAMDIAMQMPIKVSTATSNFMIGVTAAASAGVYFMGGYIVPFIAAPVAIGVLLGAMIGSQLLGRLQSSTIRIVFVVVLLWISFQMIWKGLHG
ncbi:MAG TPA: sulfite exporter TauE/SafE family protein [Lacipirellulaceae bacterium]|nr:sulfite exporter TauE/SafE family protein [Lacipirellulaceae bacterium]